MMPLWGDSSKENYKAKLEHKMCIAKETPESDFDLADCNLSVIPSGVFSMCRVFLKESLLLQNNQLVSLTSGGSLKDLSQLLMLNLKDNKIGILPEDIGLLISLQELNLENNRLKKLPESFGKLLSLHYLNIKSNKLVSFPKQICLLSKLETLNIQNNPKVKSLPKDICNLEKLRCLEIDLERIIYPPNNVCTDGIQCIMEFLCNEIGKEYTPGKYQVSQAQSEDESSNCDSEASDLSASYLQYQRTKEQRQQELLVLEEAFKENFVMQTSSAAEANSRRKKLLANIAQEQERMESEIMLLQTKKEKEKQSLLSILTNVESHSAKLIEQLMCLNDRTKSLDKMLAVLERDRIENEEIFIIKQEELEQLRKKEILENMTQMLQHEERQRKYEITKNSVASELQNDENESHLRLLSIFQERELDQQIMLNSLLEEEQYQKEAFEALQLQKDLRHQHITNQIHLIEKELSSLTLAEIKKKSLKISSDVNLLAEHRTALACLLTDLLSAKERREQELKDRLQQMELKRADEVKDFWLIQYQKLLDSKPKSIIEAELEMDADVREVLIDAAAAEYMSLFAIKRVAFPQLLTFTIQDLKQIGILDEDTCLKVLDMAKEKSERMKNENQDFLSLKKTDFVPNPSAPPLSEPSSPEMVEPSAPLLSPDSEMKLWCHAECVICMEIQSTAVFLPCGHVCCCQKCSNTVEVCPMCRTNIVSKFILTIC